jgi:hypothetical protein
MPKVASREAWLRARKELLMKEKEWNRQRDALSAHHLAGWLEAVAGIVTGIVSRGGGHAATSRGPCWTR